MKFISWNVNGLRACVTKGFQEFFNSAQADFFCLQETKLQSGQIQMDLPGYTQFWNYAVKKGYSGTAIFAKKEPLNITYGVGVEELDTEGRLITLEYPEFYLVTCYTPNAQQGLARIDHRLKWDDAFREYLCRLDQDKPVIACGDLNVAHQEIDLKNPSSNRGNAGFSDEERGKFTELLESGFTDTFRALYPEKVEYSWWSYMMKSRERNIGLKIPMPPESTAGGVTGLMPGKTTPDGALIIFWYPTALLIKLRLHPFIRTFSDQTIAL